MTNHNAGRILAFIFLFHNALAIDLTRLYGIHHKRELNALGTYMEIKYKLYI